VAVGLVTAADADSDRGYLLTVELQPSGREVLARLVGRRFLLSAAVGDEVLVLFPDGDPNRAVAFPAELVSSAAGLPSSWTNGGPQVVDAAGLEVRTSESASVQKVVTEDILTKIAGLAGEVVALAGALSSLGIVVATTNATQLVAMLPTQYRTAALRSE
jgi:phage baseplate assembly protein gpV